LARQFGTKGAAAPAGKRNSLKEKYVFTQIAARMVKDQLGELGGTEPSKSAPVTRGEAYLLVGKSSLIVGKVVGAVRGFSTQSQEKRRRGKRALGNRLSEPAVGKRWTTKRKKNR